MFDFPLFLALNLRDIWKCPSWLESGGLFCLFLGLIRKLYSSCSTVVLDCFTFCILSKVFLFGFGFLMYVMTAYFCSLQ